MRQRRGEEKKESEEVRRSEKEQKEKRERGKPTRQKMWTGIQNNSTTLTNLLSIKKEERSIITFNSTKKERKTKKNNKNQ